MGVWIPVGTLIVSVSTLVFTAMVNRRKILGDEGVTVEARLRLAEAEIQKCIADRADLRDQLFQAMAELVELRRGAGTKKPAKKA